MSDDLQIRPSSAEEDVETYKQIARILLDKRHVLGEIQFYFDPPQMRGRITVTVLNPESPDREQVLERDMIAKLRECLVTTFEKQWLDRIDQITEELGDGLHDMGLELVAATALAQQVRALMMGGPR